MIVTQEHLAENFIESFLTPLRKQFNASSETSFDQWLYDNIEVLGLQVYETLGDHLGDEIA